VAPESPAPPAAEPGHRNGKQPVSRHPSPVKGRRKQPSVSDLQKQFDKVKLNTVEEPVEVEKSLAAIDAAEELMAQKAVSDEDYHKQVNELPLLNPGQKIMNCDIGMGFRVRDGYKVSYDINSVTAAKKRDALYDKNKIWVYVAKWPGGFSWMYWTDATFGDEKLTLGQCAIRFGMGIFSKPGRCHTKEIFLDSRMTGENSFVIAIVLDGKDQVMSRQKEQTADVYRVWRSEVPQDIKQTIQLRELINIRQKSDRVRWWEM
jgi:hypothetical protein